jgi:hypothetical protein
MVYSGNFRNLVGGHCQFLNILRKIEKNLKLYGIESIFPIFFINEVLIYIFITKSVQAGRLLTANNLQQPLTA